ncbi:MAG: cytochrome-c peroxidase [Pirellulaceae bacterium]|nr:cytochrome-c peroxidase [Pirellulaceae bacterium]
MWELPTSVANKVFLAASIACCAAIIAHAGDPVRSLDLPQQPHSYREALPAHFKAAAARFDNTPADNPITDHGATLGRVLFYDKSLSVNATTSCASCHQQKFAFTDPRKLSVGFGDQAVDRNSMSLINVRYYAGGRMFWDERAETLEQQVLMPIENDLEMGHDLRELVQQLRADPIYPPLFKSAFGSQEIDKARIARALAQFVRAIVSYRSRYDMGRAQVDSVLSAFPNFNEQENYGKELFFGRAACAACHLEDSQREAGRGQTAFFYVAQPAANGIDSGEDKDDSGMGRSTKRNKDIGKFKVPSLRNIELTAPYMHDGRFHTLEQVVEHYNWSVRPHPNLDARLADFAANGMALPEREKVALTKFLLTLTDEALIKDQRFSDPFVER